MAHAVLYAPFIYEQIVNLVARIFCCFNIELNLMGTSVKFTLLITFLETVCKPRDQLGTKQTGLPEQSSSDSMNSNIHDLVRGDF